MLDPFKDEIHRLLKDDPKLHGVRVRELLEPFGCTVCKTVVDDYLREVRPLFAPPSRTFQRTVYRPGEICQFDVWVVRVSPDPFLRFDTNDYSLDPALVGRRVEISVDQRSVTAVVLDTGELACQHARVFAKHRTVTALEHARKLRTGRGDAAQSPVEIRSLARYDQLIA